MGKAPLRPGQVAPVLAAALGWKLKTGSLRAPPKPAPPPRYDAKQSLASRPMSWLKPKPAQAAAPPAKPSFQPPKPAAAVRRQSLAPPAAARRQSLAPAAAARRQSLALKPSAPSAAGRASAAKRLSIVQGAQAERRKSVLGTKRLSVGAAAFGRPAAIKE